MPVLVLGVMMMGCYRIAVWTSREIIIPIRDTIVSKSIRLLDKIDNTLVTLDSSIKDITSAMESHAKLLVDLESASKVAVTQATNDLQLCHSVQVSICDQLRALNTETREVRCVVDKLSAHCPLLVSSDPTYQPQNTCIQVQTPSVSSPNPTGVSGVAQTSPSSVSGVSSATPSHAPKKGPKQ